jgi:hypothetical protein
MLTASGLSVLFLTDLAKSVSMARITGTDHCFSRPLQNRDLQLRFHFRFRDKYFRFRARQPRQTVAAIKEASESSKSAIHFHAGFAEVKDSFIGMAIIVASLWLHLDCAGIRTGYQFH